MIAPDRPTPPFARVYGRFLTVDSSPFPGGQVFFTLDPADVRVESKDGKFIVDGSAYAEIDSFGNLIKNDKNYIDLLAPGEGVSPSDFTYKVVIYTKSKTRAFSASLKQGEVYSLADLAPVAAYSGNALTIAEGAAKAAAESAKSAIDAVEALRSEIASFPRSTNPWDGKTSIGNGAPKYSSDSSLKGSLYLDEGFNKGVLLYAHNGASWKPYVFDTGWRYFSLNKNNNQFGNGLYFSPISGSSSPSKLYIGEESYFAVRNNNGILTVSSRINLLPKSKNQLSPAQKFRISCPTYSGISFNDDSLPGSPITLSVDSTVYGKSNSRYEILGNRSELRFSPGFFEIDVEITDSGCPEIRIFGSTPTNDEYTGTSQFGLPTFKDLGGSTINFS